MKRDNDKTKAELIQELKNMRRRVTELEASEAKNNAAEEALRESEEKFSKTFSANPEVIAINKVADGTFIDVNDSFERITGFSREEAIGKNSVMLGDVSCNSNHALFASNVNHFT